MIQSKRKISILVPYQNTGNELKIYLQKRSHDMQTLPNYFGFWGGGAEGAETAEEALVREIKEELGIDLDMEKVSHFNHYEFFRSAKDIFLLEVEKYWADQIIVGEGDCGKWFLSDEATARPDIIFEDKVVINDLERLILQRSIK